MIIKNHLINYKIIIISALSRKPVAWLAGIVFIEEGQEKVDLGGRGREGERRGGGLN